MSLYATVAEVKKRLIASRAAPNRTDFDLTLLDYIDTVSRRLDDEFYVDRPLFAPYTETRRFPVDSMNVDSARKTFRFAQPLLELSAVTVCGEALTLTTHVSAYPDSTRPPFFQLLLRDAAAISSWYENISSTNYDIPAYVDITGIWGVHRRYASAWKSVDTLQAAISDTTSLTFTVANVDGANWIGLTPRLDAGSIVKVDSELMNVIAVNTTTNVVTVEARGANGTTAATHSNGAAVYVWQVEAPVRQAVARQVGLMLSRDGSYTSVELTDAGSVRYPNDWLWEVRNVMDRYAYGN